jgi:hemerythrin-like domain-containing protein
MCDTESCCELFFRYMDKVREHIDLVDRNLYGKLLAHENHEIQNLVRNFMSGSQEIKKIMSEYSKEWCPAKKTILQRIQDETEKLYPLIREISGNEEHAA